MKRVVLAYSGGLDTSVAIRWLSDEGWDVVAVAVDVGQPDDLAATVARAETLGAVEARLEDAKATYVERFVVPALHMNALYQGRYPLVSALSRPLISKVLIDVARDTKASAVAHGCTGKGNDQVRFEASLSALDPGIEVLAPVRDWGMSRSDTIAFAEKHELPITTTESSPYSIDDNLWGRSIECGVLEDPWHPPPDDVWHITRGSEQPSDEPRDCVVGFEGGAPVSVDGDTVGTERAIEAVGAIAGSYGVGRIDMIEDRLVGIKSREVYEAPAAMSLIAAHSDLEALTLERSVAAEKRKLETTWADLVYKGLWFSPLRKAIDAFAGTTQAAVTGEVRLRFSQGVCAPAGRRSPHSLYDHSLATYGSNDSFDAGDAAGFIKLWSLPTTEWSKRKSD